MQAGKAGIRWLWLFTTTFLVKSRIWSMSWYSIRFQENTLQSICPDAATFGLGHSLITECSRLKTFSPQSGCSPPSTFEDKYIRGLRLFPTITFAILTKPQHNFISLRQLRVHIS